MKITSVVLQESLLDKIKEMAKDECRSVSAMIRILLEKSLSLNNSQ